MQPFEVAFLFVIAFGVMTIAALANNSKGGALVFFVLAVICWGAYLSTVPA
jgi:hypothetical protein